MDDKRKMNIASALNIATNTMIIIFGLIYAITGTFQPYHEAFMGKTAEQVASWDPELGILTMIFFRLIGFTFISYGISLIIITFVGFRKGEKWAWITSTIEIGLFLLPLLLLTSIIGVFQLPFILTLIFSILEAIGLVMTAKLFVSR